MGEAGPRDELAGKGGSLLNENSCDELGRQPAWDMSSAKAV